MVTGAGETAGGCTGEMSAVLSFGTTGPAAVNAGSIEVKVGDALQAMSNSAAHALSAQGAEGVQGPLPRRECWQQLYLPISLLLDLPLDLHRLRKDPAKLFFSPRFEKFSGTSGTELEA